MHSRKQPGIASIDCIDAVELFRLVTCHNMQVGPHIIGLCGSASTSVNVMIMYVPFAVVILRSFLDLARHDDTQLRSVVVCSLRL